MSPPRWSLSPRRAPEGASSGAEPGHVFDDDAAARLRSLADATATAIEDPTADVEALRAATDDAESAFAVARQLALTTRDGQTSIDAWLWRYSYDRRRGVSADTGSRRRRGGDVRNLGETTLVFAESCGVGLSCSSLGLLYTARSEPERSQTSRRYVMGLATLARRVAAAREPRAPTPAAAASRRVPRLWGSRADAIWAARMAVHLLLASLWVAVPSWSRRVDGCAGTKPGRGVGDNGPWAEAALSRYRVPRGRYVLWPRRQYRSSGRPADGFYHVG